MPRHAGTAVIGFEDAKTHPKENDAALLSRIVAASKGVHMHPWSKITPTQVLSQFVRDVGLAELGFSQHCPLLLIEPSLTNP
ncbi:MAG: hypothetical protein VX620_18890, partial [Pseudomonadota bacterium]|nr:hypothetical protein [Pseudomonadota bacterium]